MLKLSNEILVLWNIETNDLAIYYKSVVNKFCKYWHESHTCWDSQNTFRFTASQEILKLSFLSNKF